MTIDRRRLLTLAAGLTAAPLLARPQRAEASGGRILLRDLYERDMSFSPLALANENAHVEISGYMAPPLKANAAFYVLTRRPMAVCPFCETSADWPDDIIAVYTRRPIEVVYYTVNLVTSGRLELGEHRDPDTGFVSMARLVDASYSRA